ncbi:hypothetical protein PoB_003102800 [Plakobranchus ocellatus]|uniref:Uncharacterized protein n=1 Tax=Plakobranchus ocellatus TaxID=259542 RepID=A0AAV4ABA9_9GAST|nr:hypothetical protein PoB_003102800 [Plakobranchus ocellatus]
MNNDDCIKGVPEAVWPRDGIHSCSQQVTDKEVEDHRTFNDSWDRVISDTEDLSDDSPYLYHPAAELKSLTYVEDRPKWNALIAEIRKTAEAARSDDPASGRLY